MRFNVIRVNVTIPTDGSLTTKALDSPIASFVNAKEAISFCKLMASSVSNTEWWIEDTWFKSENRIVAKF